MEISSNSIFSKIPFSKDERLPPEQEFFNPNPGRRNIGFSDVWNLPDEEVEKKLTNEGFYKVRKLEDGSFVGCMKLMHTMSVCIDITPTTPYAYRWCFKDPEEAFYFCDNIKEFDEIPVKRSSLQGHRFALESRLVVTDKHGFKKWWDYGIFNHARPKAKSICP